MRTMIAALVLSAAAIAVPATPASATVTVNFTGTNFTNVFAGGTPATGPHQTVQGSFSYDFDTTTNAFTLTAFSADVGATHFGLGNTLASLTGGTALSIGGTPNGAASLGFPNDFVLNMLFNPTTGQVSNAIQLQYSTADFHMYQANNLDVAAVPEPATWAMMLLGFAGIGLVARRTRTPRLAQVA